MGKEGEGGDGPTVQVVLCTGQAVNLGTRAGHFSAWHFVTVPSLLFERHATCCGVPCSMWCDVSRCKGREAEVTLTLEVTHDGDDDDGLS